jgi:short subunit dehydrogenase-like uncharacterized protein
MPHRTTDLVLYGATGYAGGLVADYIAEAHGQRIQWAIAGRRRDALDAIADRLEASFPGSRPEVIVADSSDPESLRAMAASARAVCSTVGPYARYGAPLVAACVEQGAHYCDLTGEPPFVRRMIDEHHEAARAAELAIVHCCGFDSVPSDLGVWFLQDRVIARDGAPCDQIELLMKLKGGVSGGTLASMAQIFDDASDPAIRKVLGNPYSLAPGDRGPDDREQRGVRYSELGDTWTAPFVMASINERVVRRTNQLLGHRYGTDFRYKEAMPMGSGLRGRLKAASFTAGLGAFTVGMASRRLRPLVMSRLPSPGEGPDQETLRTGFFRATLYGLRDGRKVATARIDGQGDPGYGANACMLGEAAVLLATDGPPGALGVTTPAAALGEALRERLHATRVQFTMVDEPEAA